MLRNGVVQAGDGFSVTKTSTGLYKITFAPGRISGFPIASVTMFENNDRNRVTPIIKGVGLGTSFDVLFLNSAGNPIDTQFNFVVIGAPIP